MEEEREFVEYQMTQIDNSLQELYLAIENLSIFVPRHCRKEYTVLKCALNNMMTYYDNFNNAFNYE